MQEADKSVFLVFAPVIISELYACRSIMLLYQIYAKTLFFCGHFFEQPCIWLMLDVHLT